MYVDTVYGFYGYSFCMLSWMFQHDYLDTYCSECLIRGAHIMFCNLYELMTSLLYFLRYIIDQFSNTCVTKFYMIPYNHFHSMQQNVR